MYKKDAADVGRFRTMNAIELHRDEYELAAVEETWSVQKKVMAPIWDQVRDTSLAIINTLNIEITRRLKVKMVPSSVQGMGQDAREIAEQVVLPTAVTQITQAVPATAFIMAVPNLVRGIRASRENERTSDRYKKASARAGALVSAWENASAKAMTVLSQAGVTTLITPTPEERDFILRHILKLEQTHPAWRGAWGNRFTGGDDRRRQIKAMRPLLTNPKAARKMGSAYDKLKREIAYPFWGLEGKFGRAARGAVALLQYKKRGILGSRAAAWAGASTVMIDNLAVKLSQMVMEDAPVQSQVTTAVSEQVTSASPRDSVIQRVLDENVRRAQEVQEESAERVTEEIEARSPAPPGLTRRPGFLDWVLSRARFGTRSA